MEYYICIKSGNGYKAISDFVLPIGHLSSNHGGDSISEKVEGGGYDTEFQGLDSHSVYNTDFKGVDYTLPTDSKDSDDSRQNSVLNQIRNMSRESASRPDNRRSTAPLINQDTQIINQLVARIQLDKVLKNVEPPMKEDELNTKFVYDRANEMRKGQ